MPLSLKYEIGQLVVVEPRTWAGINKPGGVGRISGVDLCSFGYVETVSVKYIVGGGSDNKIDLEFVRPHEEFLTRTSRSRRGRDIYKPTLTCIDNRESKRLRHRKVSPSPGPSQSKGKLDDVLTLTKASTSKAKATIQTAHFENLDESKKSLLKPPISVVYLDAPMEKISPLSNPRGTSSKESRISHYSLSKSKENQHSIVRRVPTSNQPNKEKKDAKEGTFKTERDHETKSESARRSMSGCTARVPLKQVFENDLEKAQRFVKNIVGYEKDKTKRDNRENTVILSVDDLTLQSKLRQHLCLFFQRHDDCIPHSAFLNFCLENSKNCSVKCSREHIENYLQTLCDEGRIMISDNEIYKI